MFFMILQLFKSPSTCNFFDWDKGPMNVIGANVDGRQMAVADPSQGIFFRTKQQLEQQLKKAQRKIIKL